MPDEPPEMQTDRLLVRGCLLIAVAGTALLAGNSLGSPNALLPVQIARDVHAGSFLAMTMAAVLGVKQAWSRDSTPRIRKRGFTIILLSGLIAGALELLRALL
jgi:hypothetical protein